MTTRDLLTTCEVVGIELSVRGDQLHVEAPAGVVTPTLRDTLQHHKVDLLRALAPATKFITLRGGVVLPWPAVALALDLEARGCALRLDDHQDVVVDPHPALTDADRAAMHRWRQDLALIIEYDADGSERLPQ